MFLAAASVALALGQEAQFQSPRPEQNAAAVVCVEMAKTMLRRNPNMVDLSKVPEGGRATISFTTTMSLKFEDERMARETQPLRCIVDVADRAVISAQVDDIETISAPVVF